MQFKNKYKTEADTQGTSAACKKMVIAKKAGEKPMERTIIPG
jgi:hypothetical protein